MKPKIFARAAISALIVGAFAIVARAQPPSVENVTVRATPTRYTGPCPGLIHFAGTITVSAPTTVSYRWERSDGQTSPVETAYVNRSRTVETNWRLGTSGKVVRGGQRLRVFTPGDVYSIEATFSVACGVQPPPPKDD